MMDTCTHDTIKRTRTGKLLGLIGIILNALLSAFKITAGMLSGSMSVTADGLNNLSDAAGSIVTYFGFRLAAKPADGKHPYGHARFEYLASLTVSVMIIFIGFELCKSSLQKIISPETVDFSLLPAIVLTVSIIVKLFMMAYYRRAAKQIDSKVLYAASQDSRNDAVVTFSVLLSAIIEKYTSLRIDGISGLLVSLFILASGISIAGNTISPILGEAADTKLKKRVTEYILSQPSVIGCHDLMVHDYGPGRTYASIHVEMDKSFDALYSHEKIDLMERECLRLFGVHLVIHFDPVALDDGNAEGLRKKILALLRIRDERLTLHDFRIVSKEPLPEIYFDLNLPEDLANVKESILSTLENALRSLGENEYVFKVTFDIV